MRFSIFQKDKSSNGICNKIINWTAKYLSALVKPVENRQRPVENFQIQIIKHNIFNIFIQGEPLKSGPERNGYNFRSCYPILMLLVSKNHKFCGAGFQRFTLGELHRSMCYDGPCPDAEEVQVRLPEACSALYERVNEPDCHVGDQQKSNNFASRLRSVLLTAFGSPPPSVENKNRLKRSLQQWQRFRDEPVAAVVVVVDSEVTAHYAEHRVDVNTALG